MSSIHLQGIGEYQAKPAGEIKIGDRLIWNYGSKSTVTSMTKETAKTVWFMMRCANGKDYERKFLKSRLVAFA